MNLGSLQPLIEQLTGHVVNSALDGVLLLGALWCVLRLAGRPNARTRFGVWFIALLGIAALPLISAHSHSVSQRLGAEITLSGVWALALFVAWAAGATALFVRLAHGLWRVHRLKKESDPAPPALINNLGIEFPRGARVLVSDHMEVPAAVGFLRPAVIVPRALLTGLSNEELQAVLLHELAHIERWDDWSNLAQKVFKALLFFHPAVLWIERRLTLEREMACDDVVLERTGGAKAYANCLISFAEKMQRMRTLALVQPLVHRMCQLSRRVAEILNSEKPRSAQLRKPLLAASVALVAGAVIASPHVPRLVAFGATMPELATTETALPSALPITPAAHAIPASYVMPASTAKSTARRRTVKATPARKHVTSYQAVAARQPAIEEQVAIPTLVIFESTSMQTSDGAQVWQLCVWQFSAAHAVAVESITGRKI